MNSATVIKPLPRPWKFGRNTASDIELREPTVKDMMEAEKEANPYGQPVAYNTALAAQTMVRAGEYTGPFAPALLKSMPVQSWRAVEDALREAEKLGEDEQPMSGPSGSASA